MSTRKSTWARAIRRPLTGSSATLRVAVAGGVVLAIIGASSAMGAGEGLPILGGQRNPTSNTGVTYSGETQIIADNSSFGTRQSNKGSGGGAIYGCRAVPGGPGCIVADNINNGLAFQFSTGGSTGGQITVANTSGAPFTTNAKGVATGLNSNYLQGYQASQFAAAAPAAGSTGATGPTGPAAVNSVALGGVAASGYEQTSALLFADVSLSGVLGANRGATSATNPSSGAYVVLFNTNVSKCAFTASPVGASLSGSIGVTPDTSNADAVDLSTPTGLGSGGFDLQVVC